MHGKEKNKGQMAHKFLKNKINKFQEKIMITQFYEIKIES